MATLTRFNFFNGSKVFVLAIKRIGRKPTGDLGGKRANDAGGVVLAPKCQLANLRQPACVAFAHQSPHPHTRACLRPPPARRPAKTMVKMIQGGTQTEAAEFLELRTLQVASVQQQQQLIQAREELEVAQAQAAAAVNDVASNVAGERDDHYRSVVKHLERTHKQALDHERAAHAASLNNELTKQRQTI